MDVVPTGVSGFGFRPTRFRSPRGSHVFRFYPFRLVLFSLSSRRDVGGEIAAERDVVFHCWRVSFVVLFAVIVPVVF